MSKTYSGESSEFDCSAYLSHGLQWPVNEHNNYNCSKSNSDAQKLAGKYTQYPKQRKTKSSVRDWGVLLQEEMNAASLKHKAALVQKDNPTFRKEKAAEKYQEKQYYESEYNTLVKWMDEGDIIVPPPSMFADKREEIQRISMVADEALCRMPCNSNPYYFQGQSSSFTCGDIANEVAFRAIETPRPAGIEGRPVNVQDYSCHEQHNSFGEVARDVAIRAIETPRDPTEVMSPGGFKNFVEEQLVGFGESCEKKNDADLRKRRLCRHFVKGFCLRADACEFLHDPSIFCTDEQKVFLGGLPLHMTSAILKAKLEEQGLTVLNKPRIMRGFTPQVCLGSVAEAEKLIATRFIYIDDDRVDVRPYQDREQLRQGLPSIVKRSVFLGGLPEKTTGDMIVRDLQRLDVKVVNFPVVKNGYAPRVVLGSLDHAKMLVSLKRVKVNGAPVDVRPYVNFRKRY